MDDVGYSRETDHERKGQKNCCEPPTMESMMEVRRCRWLSKLSVMEKSRSPRQMLGAWCPTPRPSGRPQQTIRHAYITTLKKLGFEQEKGQMREWMTVARDRPTWGTNVESRLGLPAGCYTNLHRRQWRTEKGKKMNIDWQIGLDRRI